MLSELEVGMFRAFGFIVLRGCLGAGELASLTQAFDRVMPDADRYDHFGDGGSRILFSAEDRDTAFALPAAHPRVLAAMADLWSTPCLYLGNYVISNMDDLPWHTAGVPGERVQTIRVSYYLDEMTAEQGALNVIPGTHYPEWNRGLFAACGEWEEGNPRLRLDRDGFPGAVSVHTNPGDAVIWQNRLWHSAWKREDGKERRALFYTYFPDPGDDLLLRENLRKAVAEIVGDGYLYGANLVAAAHDGLAPMIERLEALGVTRVREGRS